MMLLEQCGYIVAKDLATARRLVDVQTVVRLSREWTIILSSRKNLSTLHFQFNRLLKHYVFDCTRDRAN